MVYKGGTFGFVHCEWMLLHRTGGWEKNGKIVKEPPPAELGKARRAGLRTPVGADNSDSRLLRDGRVLVGR